MTAGAEQEADRAVWCLALGQFIAYAALLYSFPALLVAAEAGTGWSKSALALGPTVALAVAAVVSPLCGRLVDRGWGGEMLIGAPVVGALGLLVAATAQGQAGWVAGWAVAGVAQGAGFYDGCFAFLIRRLGPDARAAIIRITLVAGFAGSFTYPAGAWAGEVFGWRVALLMFAGLLAVLGVAVNAWGVTLLRRGVRAGIRAYADPPGMLARAMRRRVFWLIGLIFALVYVAHGIIITFAIPLFQGRGAGHAAAVWAAALVGAAQVAGRVLFMGWGRHFTLVGMVRSTLVAMVAAALVLWLAGAAPGLIFVTAALQGAAIGIVSILRPILIAELLGNEGFGVISGALAIG
ncbi:MAG: MFS transporter, partial [Albidovulum sp.]